MHSWQGERPECVSVVRSGAPSISIFSTIQVSLLFFLMSCFVFNIAFFSLGHILACSSVCLPGLSRHWPFPGFSQCNYTNICKMEIWEKGKERKKVSEDLLEPQRQMIFSHLQMYILDNPKDKNLIIFRIFIQSALRSWTCSQFPSCLVIANHITNAKDSLCNTKHSTT